MDSSDNLTNLTNLKIQFPDEEAKAVYAIAVPVMIFGCTLAIVLNIFVLLTIRVLRHPINPTLKLTYSLAGADIWTSLVIAGGLISHSYLPTAIHWEKASWQDCASYALEAFRLGGILTSVLHLLALASNHFAAIAYPLKYKSWSYRNAHWVDVSLFILWLGPPVIYFIVFTVYSNKTFAKRECDADFLGTLGFRVLVFFTIFIPLAILCVVYIKIGFLLRKLQTQSRRQSHECDEFTRKSNQQSNATGHHLQRRYSFVQRKQHVIGTALLIVATSLLGWLPAVVFFVVTCSICIYPYTDLHSFPWLLFTLTISVNALMILKGLLNPFVYAVRIPEIKVAIISFLGDHNPVARRKSSSEKEEHGMGERRDSHAL